ncbi:exodeoxyribonuclease I subunit C [Alteromonadaceae bacterium 2753L.S.0a.02]|nr:exodeoxyribonuclease I subunit C [Alteromonadaceae bacterium 2753L.S.0a.02]
MKTFYWHDYETWGANPAVDRPSQFAGVRTDESLNIIGDPLVIYCQPPEDIWPHPQATMVTGITPQKARFEGLPEHEFIAQIHRELAQPQTCGVGYNSIRFDDEITRYTLYRNFYDPYEREWRNGNSRWDIIDMVRLTYALRPQGIEWPMIDAKPSFKLENLTVANKILHESAHDAYSDVEATIAIARLVKTKQPQLYNYVREHSNKRKLATLIDLKNRKPLLHVSSRFSAEHGCAALVVPLAMHPINKNAVIVFDLSKDPQAFLEANAEQIMQRLYVASDDLPEGVERIPLKLVHLNKCPILATPKLLDEQAAKRLKIDKTLCEQHWQKLVSADVSVKLNEVFSQNEFPPKADPEQRLYEGFLNDVDKKQCANIRAAKPQELINHNFVFEDERLNSMLLRYQARNFPETLSTPEKAEWSEHVRLRLMDGGEGCLSFAEYQSLITSLRNEHGDNPDKISLLDELEKYAHHHLATLGLRH